MKRKILSVLFALVLVLSLTLVTAVPVAAVSPPHDRTTAITEVADRLTAEQNTGDSYDAGYIGGWRMWISEAPPGTYLRTHNIGVTAIGILKAHELEDKASYEVALAMAYKFVVDHVPGWVQDPNDATRWKESPGGVNSWPDIHFLIGLAEAAEADSSLLAAMQLEVPGVTANDIMALAKARWDDRLNHAGAVYPGEVGTAAGMADWLVYVRVPNWSSLIPWDLEAAVKSALALHEKYPEDGYLEQAQDITEVIHNCIYGDPSYLDIYDPTEKCYTLGLAGALEAFTEAGLYSEAVSELKGLLIDYQNEAGYWDANDRIDEDAGTQCVQETAYAIMALIAQGDEDARTAAIKGCNWLVNTQDVLGGWNPSSFESGDENLECDGEAAWALATTEAPVAIGDKGYYSIQSAIDAANPGDTIIVATGTYNENVVINKSLTLEAASSPVINGDITSDGVPDGSCITVSANGVTIDGFELTNGYNGIIGQISDSTIKNNIIHDNLNYGGSNGVGILLWGDNDNNQIMNNEIYNNDRQGIFIGFWDATQLSTENTISGNVIYNNGLYTQPNGPDASAYGIQLWNSDENAIEENEIYNHDDWFYYPGFDFAQGIYLCASFNNTVSGNYLHNNNYGVGVWTAGRSPVGLNQINFNEIVGNTGFGVMNFDAVVVDATLNWWGDVSGPLHSTSWEYGGVEITNPHGEGDEVSDYVLYEPWIGQGGMVTGGGWIYSSAGAYKADTQLEGKATFGFASRYKKGAAVPTGNTQFNFHVADLNFHSDSYDWLVIAGDNARFKGTGTVNGEEGYRLMLWAGDSDPDTFRIKIWTEDNGTETVIYDNGMNQPIGGGNIVIHKSKN